MTTDGRVATPLRRRTAASTADTRALTGGRIRSDFAVVLALLAYLVVLAYGYVVEIAPSFGYMGLTYRRPEAIPLGVSVALLGALSLAMPRSVRRVSDFLQLLNFVVVVVPSVLLAQLATTLAPSSATVLAVVMTGVTVLIRLLTAVAAPARAVPADRHSWARASPIWVLIALLTVLLFGAILVTFGLQLRLLTFADVYAVRASFKIILVQVPVMGYLLPVLHNCLNPLWMVRGLRTRRLAFYLVGAVGQLAIYLVSGHKFVLLSVVAVPVVYWIAERGWLTRTRLMSTLAGGLTGVLLLSWLTGSVYLISVLFTRLVVIPGALTSAYVRVFDVTPRVNFAQLTGDGAAMSNAYRLVGRLFFAQDGNNANVNFYGDGYANMGYNGMVIEGVVFALLLVGADRATRGMDPAAASVVFVTVGIAMTNSSSITALLTHGVFALCVFTWLLSWYSPRKKTIPGGRPETSGAGRRNAPALVR